MNNISDITPIITLQGLGLLFDYDNTGISKVPFTHVAFGVHSWNPNAEATELKQEIARVKIKEGDRPIPSQINIRSILEGPASGYIYEIGLYSNDTLFSIWSNKKPYAEHQVIHTKSNISFQEEVKLRFDKQTTLENYSLIWNSEQEIFNLYKTSNNNELIREKIKFSSEIEAPFGKILLNIEKEEIPDNFDLYIRTFEGEHQGYKASYGTLTTDFSFNLLNVNTDAIEVHFAEPTRDIHLPIEYPITLTDKTTLNIKELINNIGIDFTANFHELEKGLIQNTYHLINKNKEYIKALKNKKRYTYKKARREADEFKNRICKYKHLIEQHIDNILQQSISKLTNEIIATSNTISSQKYHDSLTLLIETIISYLIRTNNSKMLGRTNEIENDTAIEITLDSEISNTIKNITDNLTKLSHEQTYQYNQEKVIDKIIYRITRNAIEQKNNHKRHDQLNDKLLKLLDWITSKYIVGNKNNEEDYITISNLLDLITSKNIQTHMQIGNAKC